MEEGEESDVPCPLGSLEVVLPLLLLLLSVYKVSRCSSSGMYKTEREPINLVL